LIALFSRFFLNCRLLLLSGLAVLLSVSILEAQRRLPPRQIPYTELEREEGMARLAEMRELGVEGVYTLLFEIRVMPRRGEEKRFQGQLWGSRNAAGPVFRYEIWDPENENAGTERLLVQSGGDPSVWMVNSSDLENGVRQISEEEIFEPLGELEVAPFDFQLPFVYWKEFEYEGLSRVRGRSSHGFLMKPPGRLSDEFPWLKGVRMFLDAEFNAMTGAEIVGEKGVLRSFNIIDIKKVGDQWIVKTIDFRDETTGDKSRLRIGAAALDLDEEMFDFSPDGLLRAFPAVSRDEFDFF